ncbi:acyl-CoA dehydrogenase [Streptomyces diacarni]|uniref:Acyl-CoA dehydrogenase n=1 Tax=Streptomyces diacarni TaxID=2800381 RepID=A0A367F545_9ACTN|nr:acyl-CoA dehydrogenase [Streptomyces diacarni]RCG24855.1 acyl-CoA dehydrogenase [Streptomyces diacarni]
MDFSLGEELEAVRELARKIFTDRATPERLRTVETSATRVDQQLWDDLAAAGLLGVVLPEEAGGAGLGPAGLCLLLEEQGRCVAPVPLWSALVAAMAVSAHGSARQRAARLPSAVDGSARIALALEEFGPAGPDAPLTTATHGADGWRISGTKAAVPSPGGAGHVLLTAATGAGPRLFLVAADAAGLTWEEAETTSHDLSAHLGLDGAAAEALGDPGSGAVRGTLDLASVALAAVQLGVAQGALRHAAGHLAQREQFGRPLATFQAVRHQLADCYIDIEAMRMTLWQAVTALEDGEGATRAALVAKWWATEGGANVVHRVQHVHGGIGVDIDYPVHRHFLWGRQLATTLGGAGADLFRLGEELAHGGAAS